MQFTISFASKPAWLAKWQSIPRLGKIGLLVMAFLLLTAEGCTSTPPRVSEAIDKVQLPDNDNYFNRQQIADREELNDQPNKLIFWYFTSPTDGKLLMQYTCKGLPASSTESLEPNHVTDVNGYQFIIPLEGGIKGKTDEAMGLDGTFGEEVPYRFCISPEGHYLDSMPGSMSSFVSDVPLQFTDAGYKYNTSLEAKKLIAEQALASGGCVDDELNVITCPATAPAPAAPTNTPTP